jgi:hypothetical protein
MFFECLNCFSPEPSGCCELFGYLVRIGTVGRFFPF